MKRYRNKPLLSAIFFSLAAILCIIKFPDNRMITFVYGFELAILISFVLCFCSKKSIDHLLDYKTSTIKSLGIGKRFLFYGSPIGLLLLPFFDKRFDSKHDDKTDIGKMKGTQKKIWWIFILIVIFGLAEFMRRSLPPDTNSRSRQWVIFGVCLAIAVDGIFKFIYVSKLEKKIQSHITEVTE